MRRLYVALVALVLTAPPALASDATDVMGTVQRFTAAFNKGDVVAAPAECVDDMSIIDEFPPHEWHGPGTCLKWMTDYDADAKKNGITDGFVTLMKPKYVDVAGDRAYVVVPANYTYKLKGKPVKESGSMFTLALVKLEAGWKLSGWAWAKK